MILDCPTCGSSNRVPAKRLEQAPRCGKCKTALPTDAPIAVHAGADFEELIADAPHPVLVDFWAPWCGPCRLVGPELATLAKRRRGALVVAKVNTDELPELGARLGIRSIPTMVLFSSGRESRRISGAMGADAIARELGV
jgi:thioredoxin 2